MSELERLWRGWQDGDRTVLDELVNTARRHGRFDVLRELELELLPGRFAELTWTAVQAGLSRGQRLRAMRWAHTGPWSVARVEPGGWTVRDEATSTWRERLTATDVQITRDWLVVSHGERGRRVISLADPLAEPLEFPSGPLAIHPGGRSCVGVGVDQRLYHHALPDGHLVGDTWRPPGRVGTLAYSGDGRRLVATVLDLVDLTWSLLVWELGELPAPRDPIPVPARMGPDLRVSRDGDRAVLVADQQLLLVDLDRGEWASVAHPAEGALQLTLSPWGALPLVASSTHLVLQAPRPVRIEVRELVASLTPSAIGQFDPDNRDLAVRGRAEMASPALVALDWTPDGTLHVAFDDGLLATTRLAL